MFKPADAETLFIIPIAAWNRELTISPKRDHLKIKNWKKEIGDPEDMAAPLICGVNGKEELQVIARNKDGTLDWVKPNAYTYSFAGEGCAEISASESVLELKGLKLTEAPLVLTVTLKERPELSASLSVTVEKPQQLWIMPHRGSHILDLRRQQLLDVMNKPRRCSADEDCLKELYIIPEHLELFGILARYSDGRYAWINNEEILASLSETESFALETDYHTMLTVRTCDSIEYGCAAELTVKSAADDSVQCRVHLVCKSENTADEIFRDINDNCILSVFTAFKDNNELSVNRSINSDIFHSMSVLQFGVKLIEMSSADNRKCQEETLLLYSHPERKDDFIALLRSACRYCGLESVLLLENGRVYKLDPDGRREDLGCCSFSLPQLEEQYSAYRGSVWHCGDVLRSHWYREGPSGFISGTVYKFACDDLKKYGEEYFQEIYKGREAGE